MRYYDNLIYSLFGNISYAYSDRLNVQWENTEGER